MVNYTIMLAWLDQPSLLVLVKQILILAGFWWIGYLLHQKLGVPVSAGIKIPDPPKSSQNQNLFN
jgi:hypothetical protein